MAQAKIQTTDEFLDMSYISHFYDEKTGEMVCFAKDVKRALVEFTEPIALDFCQWKDKNFYESDSKYYPKVSSLYFELCKLISFEPQAFVKLPILYQYWTKLNLLKVK